MINMPVELDNEVALVRLAQSGSTESFGILVNRYERQVYRLVRAITKNTEDAEDVLQETFLKAYTDIQGFNGESRFYTWLARISMDETLSKLRLHHVPTWNPFDEVARTDEVMSKAADLRDWHDNPEECFSESEISAILSNALDDLETPLRAVVALHDIEGFSSEETVYVLRLSAAAVRTLLTRSRLKLRQNLSIWFENHSAPATGQGDGESVRHSLAPSLAEDRECTRGEAWQ